MLFLLMQNLLKRIFWFMIRSTMAEVGSTKGYVLFALPKIKETKLFYHLLCKLQDFNTSSR